MMTKAIVFSLIESPSHPNFSQVFEANGYEEVIFFSVRKIINALKKTKPDVVIAQFHYLYVSDYASNHISNLDSLIVSLQKYSDYQPKFIFLVSKQERQYIEKLTNHYLGFAKSIHELVLPVRNEQISELL